MKILITGATGMVGSQLGQVLAEQGHELFVISRDRERALLHLPFPAEVIEGDLSGETLRDERLKEVEAVVHLAGENVADGRWTGARRQRIYDSRVQSLHHLLSSLEWSRLKVFISTSAVGFYGDRGDEILTEKSDRGEGFLSQVCQDWEQPLLLASRKNEGRGPRVAIFRFGVVLGEAAGALAKMIEPFRAGLAGNLGKGQQWMSWIHIEDLVKALAESLHNPQYSGILNAVSPQPVTNHEFSLTLSSAVREKPRLGPPVPGFALKAAFGEMSSILLASQRVMPERLLQMGFQFRYPDLASALKPLCQVYKEGDCLFVAEQFFALPLEKVFPFFAEAHNLEKITPPLLNFKITGMSTPAIQQGTLIDYQLRIHKVPVHWKTLIQTWNPPISFVDNQEKGPYRKWHHTHSFSKLGKGTLMIDRVRYRLPMGALGQLTAGAWVKSDIEKIFAYRRKAALELLPSY